MSEQASGNRQSARTTVANRANCTRLADCPAVFHHEDCQRWTDQRARHHGEDGS